MDVVLMSFSKKRNSTAAPSGSGTAMAGTLRDGCSVIRPVIGFGISRTTSPVNYNYAVISDFGRKYFIQEWTWDSGLWWASMEVDTMGSFKDQIGRQAPYIMRSSQKQNRNISEGLYPSISFAYTHTEVSQHPLIINHSLSDGTYIVGVIGQGNTAMGAVNYYAMTSAGMASFRSGLLTDPNYMGIMEITAELKKALVNPFQYVVSCIWFPISYDSIIGNSVSSIDLGWWTITTSAKAITEFTFEPQTGVAVSIRPVEQAYREGGGFRYASPFSSYLLIVPPFGEIEIDAQILAPYFDDTNGWPITQIVLFYKVDLITGNAYLEVYNSDHTTNKFTYCIREGKFGVPVQLGQLTANAGGALSSASVLVGALSSQSAGMAVAETFSGLLSGVQSSVPRVMTTGMNAGLSIYDFHIKTISKYNPPLTGDPEELGRPLCEVSFVSEAGGYIKCYDSHPIITGATDFEESTIKTYMDGGFFYE